MSNVSGILSDTRWGSLFSLDLYKKVKQNDPSVSPSDRDLVSLHSLKYLIALNGSNESICTFIDKLKKNESRQKIDSQFPSHKITALHIAIMKDRQILVEKLIEAGADLDLQDIHGWSPLHHAALVSNNLVKLLLKIGAKNNTKTLLDGTYSDLLDLIRREGDNDREFSPYKALSSDSEKVRIRNLSERLNIDYIDECVWPKELLYHLWTALPKNQKGKLRQEQIRTQLYPQLKLNPPKISLKEIKILDSTAIGVVAEQFIAPFILVGEYTGEIIKREKRVSNSVEELTYSFLLEEEKNYMISVDAEKMGNWTRYMNDGFPNVFSFDLFNTAGQKCRKVFFTADPEGIKEGEPLIYDYSWLYFELKWGHYALMEKEKLRTFFKNFNDHYNSFIQMRGSMKNSADPKADYLELVKPTALLARLLYPFQTPMALMDLVFSETIDPSEWLTFVDKEKENSFFKCVFQEDNCYHDALYGLLWDLMEFDSTAKKLSKASPGQEIMKKVRQFFLASEDILPVRALQDKLGLLNSFFTSKSLNVKTNLTREEIETISKETENFCISKLGAKFS